MVKSSASTPDEYVASLPDDRREAVATVREVVNRNLPPGYTEGMAYGAPKGADGATAYSLELAGVDGQGSANLGRTAAAAGVFGLAGGAVLLRRRLL